MRRQKNRKRKIIIDDVRFEFAGAADALDGGAIDVEYTETMCQHLMGCTAVTHPEMNIEQTIRHIETVLASDNGSGRKGARYHGVQLTKILVGEDPNQIVYAEEGGKIYVRARGDQEGNWTLKRA